MSPPLIVGDDGTERSQDALALAGILAPLLDAEPVTVTVPGHRSPAKALDELARAEGTELIVLGSTHRGALGRVYPGSVAERLLSGGPCAIAIAPLGYADRATDRLRVIEVGFKGTPESDAALAWAERLAVGAGATMRVFAAFEVGADEPGPLALQARNELAARLHEAEARIPDEVRPLTRLVNGNPVTVLTEEADAGVDLLVLGSRGYGPVATALLGGVSGQVTRSASCPVLVVPRPAAPAAPGGAPPA